MIFLIELLLFLVQVVIFRQFGRLFLFIISEWQWVVWQWFGRLVNMFLFLWWIGEVLLCMMLLVWMMVLLQIWLMFWWFRYMLRIGVVGFRCWISFSDMFVLLGVYGLGEMIMCLGFCVVILFMFIVLLCIIFILVFSVCRYCMRLQVKLLQLLIIYNMVRFCCLLGKWCICFWCR